MLFKKIKAEFRFISKEILLFQYKTFLDCSSQHVFTKLLNIISALFFSLLDIPARESVVWIGNFKKELVIS